MESQRPSSDGFARQRTPVGGLAPLPGVRQRRLWVLPTAAALVALAAGYAMSQVADPDRSSTGGVPGHRRRRPRAAHTVSSTVVTVIALVLGLTVVALQLSSTQFSPRLLRNFLRDRATQVVLSVFTATFVYSAAGLFTVGRRRTHRGVPAARHQRVDPAAVHQPRLRRVLRRPPRALDPDRRHQPPDRAQHPPHHRPGGVGVGRSSRGGPEWAVPLVGRSSGYIQTVHPELLLPLAAETDVTIGLRHRVGHTSSRAP